MLRECSSQLVALALGAALSGLAVARQEPNREVVLEDRIDRVLAKVQARELNSGQRSPWSIMHGMIAFGEDAVVYDAGRNERVDAVTFLLTRAAHEGRPIFHEADGLPTLPIHKRVQHHPDQYLMGFALTGVPLERSFTADSGRRFTIADLVAAAQRDFVDDQEPGWTLVALSTYAGCARRWTAASGREYGIEDVVRLAIQRDPVQEAEGGTHHLFGVAYAVRRCGGTSTDDVWADARSYLRRYVDRARKLQQDDGAFSGALFEKSAPPKSPSDLVFSTGHTLEIFVFACSREELTQPWVRRAVERLCREIESHPLSAFSDGGIYHAANALRRYRDATR